MAVFLETSTSFGTGNCSILPYYNKTKHDLFSYASDPVFGSVAWPGSNGGVWPTGFNSKCYINDAPYKINCTGVSLRTKTYGGSAGDPYRCLNQPTSGCFGTLPSSVTPEQETRLRNIGYWNNGQFNVVLISPRHAVSTRHWLTAPAPNQTAQFTFLKTDNTQVTKNFVRVLTGSEDLIEAVAPGSDFTVWRITDAADLKSEIDSGLLKCYPEYFDVEDPATLSFIGSTFNILDPSKKPIGFKIDGNDRVLRGVSGYSAVSKLFYIQPEDIYGSVRNKNNLPHQPYDQLIMTGDSGSQLFVYSKNLNKTIYLGSAYGSGSSVGYSNSSAKIAALNAELSANGGYSLSKINVTGLTFMSLGDWSNVDINYNDGLLNIPEILGKFLVKPADDVATLSPVRELWTKANSTDTTPSLIWSVNSTVPTEPVGPCDGYGVCAAGSFVHYPLVPNTADLTERWDCADWKTTAQTVGMNPTVVQIQDPDWINGVSDPNDRYCANVYSFNQLSAPGLVPPPPTYVVAEFESYTVADSFTLFLKNNYIKTASSLMVQPTVPLFPPLFTQTTGAGTIFNTRHGGISPTYYYLNGTCSFSTVPGLITTCPCDAASCGEAGPIDPNSQSVCGCGQTDCNSLGVQIQQQGGNPCTSVTDYIQNSDVYPLITVGCAATDFCTTEYPSAPICQYGTCHGTPYPALTGDTTPSGGYERRLVGKMPQNMVNYIPSFDGGNLATARLLYNSMPTFNEFAMLSQTGCDSNQCNPSVPGSCHDACPTNGGRCPSGWLVKIFTPFYVSIPSSIVDPGTGNIVSLVGKYVEYTKKQLKLDQVANYNGFPLLKEMYHVLTGSKRASGLCLGIPMTDSGGFAINSGVLNPIWAAIEMPKIKTNGTCSHTHQVIIEMRNSSANNCQSCINNGPPNQNSESLVMIRLFPITNESGVVPESIFKRMLTGRFTLQGGVSATGGISSIYTYKLSGDNSGSLYLETSTQSNAVVDTDVQGVQQDIFNYNTGNITPSLTGQPKNPNNLTYLLAANIFNQHPIQTTVNQDCLCNQV